MKILQQCISRIYKAKKKKKKNVQTTKSEDIIDDFI